MTDTTNNTPEQTENFIMPYPQEELGGEPGLTSMDLAKILGVRHWVVLDKISRIDTAGWEEYGWTIKTAGTVKLTNGRGRPIRPVIFNVPAAKVSIARWDNKKGNGYLNWLFRCETFVEQEVPKIQAKFEEFKLAAKNEIDQLKAENEDLARKAKIKKRPYRREVVTERRTMRDLFGNVEEVVYTEKREWHNCTDEQRKEWLARKHLSTAATCATKANKLMKDLNKEQKKRGELIQFPNNPQ